MPIGRLAIMAMAVGMCFMFTMDATAATAKQVIYVSGSGSDSYSGRIATPNKSKTDGPVRTFERARDIIREIKSEKGLPKGGIDVEIKGGTYEISKAFELNAQDSGTADSPITYRAAKGQAVYIVGGKVLKGFKTVSDPTMLAKMDEKARGKVLYTNLKAQGITQFPQMVSAQQWANSEPGLELFFANEPMTLSRWPNEGYTRIVDVKGPTPMDIRGTVGTVEGIFTYEGDRPSRWINEPDLMTNGYWFWDWADQRFRVKSIDLDTKTITLENPPMHAFGFRKGQWFYIYNALIELDKPGEWYLDRKNGDLFFWPPKPLNSGKAMVSIIHDMLNMNNVSFINIQGLTFECAQASAINVNDCFDCVISKCVMRNLGSAGVNINGGLRNTVFGCDMYNLGNGGVNVSGGDRPTLTPGKHNVENCHIYKFERWNPIYKPAISINGVGNRAAHNLLNDAPHMAIGLSGNDHIIEYNEIHSVVYESNDAGAFYCGRNWTMRGNKIRYNYFHHIYGFENRGCVGVYLDDQFSSADIYGNVHYQVPMASFIGGGRDCTIENNIYVDCNPAIHIDARGLGWAAPGKDTMLEGLNAVPYKEELWRSRYPELVNILDNDPMAPKNLLVTKNICVGGRWEDVENIARPGVTFKDNLVDVDPQFVDAKNLNFNLKPTSPAFKIGFKPIPINKIGLYKDPLRASWPVITKPRPAPKSPESVSRKAPVFNVEKINKIPVVDGVLSNSEWPAKAMKLQEDTSRNKISGKPATAYLAHDGKSLYVAVVIPIADRNKIKLGSQWGSNDGAEICFRPADLNVPAYVVRGFAGGECRSESEAGVSSEAANKLGRSVKFAARVDDNRWIGEWSIPLKEAKISYKPGFKLAFNIGIMRTQSGEWITWAGALGQNWKVENAGVIVIK